MANPFLEERLPVGIRMGAMYSDEYDVEIVQTSGGQEYRALKHPYPVRYFDISFVLPNPKMRAAVANLYHRSYGKFAGFRVKALDEFTTNANTSPPTAFDQPLAVVTEGSVYQLQAELGSGGTPLDIGLPVRTIFKPVAGTVKIGLRNGTTDIAVTPADVDYTTGLVTLAADKTDTVTAISKAANAVLTVGSNAFIVGDSVHVSGVVGMTQINGLRAAVVSRNSTSITLDIDSTAFSDYTSGGTVNTAPQTGEEVRGGCEFDIPCRFNSRLEINHISKDIRDTGNIELVELIAL